MDYKQIKNNIINRKRFKKQNNLTILANQELTRLNA
uniref:Uncharacterized protein n=1 Tax=Nelumbo nucifera TaxID=4432 RepID=A0A822ZF55_NELNU|nr:TPA_asm: hypothetical protein HUJ06_001982 [Nelumbo nucifera]